MKGGSVEIAHNLHHTRAHGMVLPEEADATKKMTGGPVIGKQGCKPAPNAYAPGGLGKSLDERGSNADSLPVIDGDKRHLGKRSIMGVAKTAGHGDGRCPKAPTELYFQHHRKVIDSIRLSKSIELRFGKALLLKEESPDSAVGRKRMKPGNQGFAIGWHKRSDMSQGAITQDNLSRKRQIILLHERWGCRISRGDSVAVWLGWGRIDLLAVRSAGAACWQKNFHVSGQTFSCLLGQPSKFPGFKKALSPNLGNPLKNRRSSPVVECPGHVVILLGNRAEYIEEPLMVGPSRVRDHCAYPRVDASTQAIDERVLQRSHVLPISLRNVSHLTLRFG